MAGNIIDRRVELAILLHMVIPIALVCSQPTRVNKRCISCQNAANRLGVHPLKNIYTDTQPNTHTHTHTRVC